VDNLLHDEIDYIEELRDEAEAVVDRVRERLVEIAANASSFEEVLQEANVLVANELAEITTRAVQSGFEFAEKKLEKAGRKAGGE